MSKLQLLLASKSPRRAALLREAGYIITQVAPPFDDPPQPEPGAEQTPQELAIELARAKAMSFLDEPLWQQGGHVLVAADTLIVHDDGSIAGTPTNLAAARMMIQRFLGVWHHVVTGVAVLGPEDQEPLCFVDTAGVWIDPIDADQLEAYLAKNAWQGKAGGYNLFERQAAGWPIEVQGDPTTVVGLPMELLTAELEKWNLQRQA